MLNTIKLPKNLKLLSDRLPKSQYEEGMGKKDASRHQALNGGENANNNKSLKTIAESSQVSLENATGQPQ